MKAPLLHSGYVHATNLSTGVIMMITCTFFFGWDTYGEVSLIVALSLLATQVAVLGNPGLMVASLSKVDRSQHNSILNSFIRRTQKPHAIIILTIVLLTTVMAASETKKISFLSLYGVLAIGIGTIVSPYNKMILSSLTLPTSYFSFVLLSSTKNVLIVVFLGISVILDSGITMLYSVALAEVSLFPILASIKRAKFNSELTNRASIENEDTWREQASVFFITMYFELLGKYDFYIFSIFMEAKTFGLYALISNVNESMQTYLGSVRTQITPHYSINRFNTKNQLNQNLFLVRVILALLAISGFIFIYFFYRFTGDNLEAWPIVYVLLISSSLVMIKTLVYGNVYVQRNRPIKLAQSGIVHLLILSVGIFLTYFTFGIVPSLIVAIGINYSISKYIFRNIPIGGGSK
jgi:hypothetical protein